MLYIPKIDDYLEILTDEEVKDFAAINFSESIREEQNLRKVAKLLYFLLTTPDEVQSDSSDNYIRHYNVKILNLFGFFFYINIYTLNKKKFTITRYTYICCDIPGNKKNAYKI